MYLSIPKPIPIALIQVHAKKKKNAARKCRSLTFNMSTPDNPFSMQFLALSLTDFILEYI